MDVSSNTMSTLPSQLSVAVGSATKGTLLHDTVMSDGVPAKVGAVIPENSNGCCTPGDTEPVVAVLVV